MPVKFDKQLFCFFSLVVFALSTFSQDNVSDYQSFLGHWTINEELSDDTDKQVEIAIKAAGGRIPRTDKKGKGRYRGGPKEHAIYDHISYDDSLHFQYLPPEFQLVYDDGFERIFHSDNRKRVVSASGTVAGDNQDFSFATWDEGRLIIETRARDGGWIYEVIEATEDTLTVTLELNPSSFAEPIKVKRIYNRPITSQ
ncbi:MAG: hypothetical protein HKN08_07395 [Gammaproteobacteria bacterium]|nr:hypothetical protein [Gammaproteobacteria bacterium]